MGLLCCLGFYRPVTQVIIPLFEGYSKVIMRKEACRVGFGLGLNRPVTQVITNPPVRLNKDSSLVYPFWFRPKCISFPLLKKILYPLSFLE